MDSNERRVIDDLFARLGELARRAAPRDAEAEALIGRHLASLPSAPYHMAQAIVVQQEALAHAQGRIEQLERDAADGPAGGGFLGGLFGGAARQPALRPTPPGQGQPRLGAGPWSQPSAPGGGFLAGAAQTAMGVAGGVLIANAIAGLLAPDPAAATEPGSEDGAEADGPNGDDDPFGDAGDLGFEDF